MHITRQGQAFEVLFAAFLFPFLLLIISWTEHNLKLQTLTTLWCEKVFWETKILVWKLKIKIGLAFISVIVYIIFMNLHLHIEKCLVMTVYGYNIYVSGVIRQDWLFTTCCERVWACKISIQRPELVRSSAEEIEAHP